MAKHTIELYNSRNGFRLKILSPNGREILANGQGISNKKDIKDMLSNFLEAIKLNNFQVLENDINITLEFRS